MSIIEAIKILTHLRAKCKAYGLGYSFFVYDEEYLEVKIWRKHKRIIKDIMDESISLQSDSDTIKGLLLSINEAIAKHRELNPIFN